MTLPKEIRNIIYEYVFCDNVDHFHEPIRYDRDVGTVMADVPTRVNLERSSPPSKETILACRELYLEMKGMYIVAYRAYWSDNRFTYNPERFEPTSFLPPNKDMRHIQHFCVLLLSYQVHIVSKRGKWVSWILPPNNRLLKFNESQKWVLLQDEVKDAIREFVACIATTRVAYDPRRGRGLTRDVLQDLSSDKVVIGAVQSFQDSRTISFRFELSLLREEAAGRLI